jgi:arylsulfatase A-like enzyme
MNNKFFLKGLALLSFFWLISSSLAQQTTKPNIVVILADDAGYADFGFQNNLPAYKQATPHLDQLATQSMRFTQAYVSANVCAPSRAGLLTGMWQPRFGFRDNLPSHSGKPQKVWFTEQWKEIGLDVSVKTMGDHLNKLGYFTGLVGKWHLGYEDRFAPHNRGFDFFEGIRAGSRAFFQLKEIKNKIPPDRYHQREKNGIFLPESEIKHVTKSQGDAALEFIDEASADKNPFFLLLSFTAPHAPLQPDLTSYEKAKQLFPNEQKKRQQYMGLVIGMDEQVGRLTAHLQAKGMADNTIIVFLSDNGGSKKNYSNNGDLRGHKWTPFEGGYRVPMLIKWPGTVKPASNYHSPIISLDLLPTFINAAGGKQPTDLDGVQLQPIFTGKTLAKRNLFWWDTNSEGLTSTALVHPWKLVTRESAVRGSRKFNVKGDGKPWLFNIEQDPKETRNLAKNHPEKVKQMKSLFKEWVSEMEKPRW